MFVIERQWRTPTQRRQFYDPADGFDQAATSTNQRNFNWPTPSGKI